MCTKTYIDFYIHTCLSVRPYGTALQAGSTVAVFEGRARPENVFGSYPVHRVSQSQKLLLEMEGFRLEP